MGKEALQCKNLSSKKEKLKRRYRELEFTDLRCTSNTCTNMGQMGWYKLREAKIGYFRSEISVEQDIARFYVPVYNMWVNFLVKER